MTELLSIKLSKLVHDECQDVSHDIGLRLLEIVITHISNMEVSIDISKFFDESGRHITKKEYGVILINELCTELE